MSIPFYANSEKLSTSNASMTWIIYLLYFVLSIGTFCALLYFDGTQSKLVQLLLAGGIIGLPCVIIAIGKRNIWRHGDEYLQSLYLKHSASTGVSALFMLITWQLWGRLTNDNIWDNTAISMAPYIMLAIILQSVRRDLQNA